MAFKFVPYTPEGSGGKDPVLAELTVTENGVYDNPIIGLEPISWDGTYAGGFMIEMGTEPDVGLVKVSDTVPSVNDLAYATFTVSTGESFSFDGDTSQIVEGPGALLVQGDAMWVINDPRVLAGMGVEFVETGTYMFYAPDMTGYIASITFPSTPADGWNKVTVNVAGDIVDVAELPTDGIEQEKIYRVVGESSTIYGIPNDATVQRLVDGVWTTLT